MNENKRIKDIQLNFENLEDFTIPADYIAFLNITDITENVCAYEGNVASFAKTANDIFIIFKKDVDKQAVSSFDVLVSNAQSYMPFSDRLILFSDVVSVVIHYEDDTMDEYSVKWMDGKNEQDNKCQSVYPQQNENMRGFGGLCLHIGKVDSYRESIFSAVAEDDNQVVLFD